MIWLFLRREPLLRYLPLALLLAAGVEGVLLAPLIGILLDSSAYEGSVDPHATPGMLYTAIIQWVLLQTVVAFALMIPLRQRVHEYERALPAARRDIVLGRLGALAVFLGAPLLVAFLLVLVMNSALAAPVQWLAVGAQLFTSLVLALLCFASYRPERDRLGVLETVAASVVALVVIYLPTRWGGDWLPLVYLLVSAGLGVRLFRRLGQPSEWQMASASSPGERELVPWRTLFHPLRWTVLRSTVLRPQTLMMLAFLVAILATEASDNPVFVLWFPLYLVWHSVRLGLGTLREFGSLPYPRSSFVRHCTWPALVALLLGSSGGFLFSSEASSIDVLERGVLLDRYSEDTLASDGDHRAHLRVPAGLWSLAHGDAAPVIEAPFGEVLEPTFHPVWWGSDLGVYNPYEIDDDSTVRFMTWQVSRALAATGIDQLSPEEVHARWFADIDLETKVDDISGWYGRDLRPWGGPVSAPRPLRQAGLFALLALLAWGLGVAGALLASRPPGTSPGASHRRKSLQVGVIAVVALLVLLFAAHGMQDRVLLPVVVSLAARGLDALLGGSALAWLGLNLGLFLVLDRVLLRMAVHIDPPVIRNGWTRRELPAY